MARFKITIEYDGTGLLGWQKQDDGPSVQGYLEKAIRKFYPSLKEVYGAGRTDAGVHALKQVAHLDLDNGMDASRVRDAINGVLKPITRQVVVLNAEKVDDDFHARFSATYRGYLYRITNRRAPLSLDKDRSWWVVPKLDVKKMQEAASYLIGKHDFSSFRAAECQANTPIKTLDRLDVIKVGDEIHLIVEAKSFLHHQVRNFAGTLKMVGEGKIQPKEIIDILEAKDRKKAGVTAPAHGLYLTRVDY
jgi:tRNA pseudouridine38-40 synthase